jgi:putative transcriptional regulator
MAIRVRLSVMMAERKMSLTELSALVGVSIQNLSILKSGRARAIRFSTLEALCRALDCTPGELIDLEEEDEGKILRPAWGQPRKRAPP